jgi:hypothetical protein
MHVTRRCPQLLDDRSEPRIAKAMQLVIEIPVLLHQLILLLMEDPFRHRRVNVPELMSELRNGQDRP